MNNFLDLLNENTEMFVEATNIGIEPSMVGIQDINDAMLEESFQLESSMVYTANKLLLTEGAEALQEASGKAIFKNVYAKIKSIVMKMWAKMKEFFNNVKLYFQKFFQKGSKFAETYQKEIEGISSVSIEGYAVEPSSLNLKSMWKSMEGIAQGIKEGDTTAAKLDEMSQKVVSQPSKSFKLGCQTKIKWTGKPIQVTFSGAELMKILKDTSTLLNAVTEDNNSVESAYKEAVSKLDQAISANGTATEAAKSDSKKESLGKAGAVLTNKCSLLKDALGLINTAAGIKAGALKLKGSQAQKAAYKGIAEARKSDNKK